MTKRPCRYPINYSPSQQETKNHRYPTTAPNSRTKIPWKSTWTKCHITPEARIAPAKQGLLSYHLQRQSNPSIKNGKHYDLKAVPKLLSLRRNLNLTQQRNAHSRKASHRLPQTGTLPENCNQHTSSYKAKIERSAGPGDNKAQQRESPREGILARVQRSTRAAHAMRGLPTRPASTEELA